MSLKDKLTKKTEGLVPSSAETLASPNRSALPKTGPGQMLAFRTHMHENSARVTDLESQVKALSEGKPSLLLDPKKVLSSKWANRHATSFTTKAFAELKSEIALTGGNVQPIKVRPLDPVAGTFETVFGHRRHRACLELELPVLAIVEQLDDQQLFIQMDSENRARKDLSPWEQGVMYKKALDGGLFPSLRQLAASLGVDVGNASKAIAVARLPEDVILAFPTPLAIQFRWFREISEALQKDPERVLTTARGLKSRQDPSLTARQVLAALLSSAQIPSRKVTRQLPFAVVREEGGGVLVKFTGSDFSEARVQELKRLLKQFCNS